MDFTSDLRSANSVLSSCSSVLNSVLMSETARDKSLLVANWSLWSFIASTISSACSYVKPCCVNFFTTACVFSIAI